jgi:hypothetical protein
MEVSRMARATDPAEGRFASEAKKRLIATVPKLKIAATHSKHAYITISNRNKKPSSAIAIFLRVSLPRANAKGVANPARALAADSMRPTPIAPARLTPPERGCYIELFARTGDSR